MFKLGNEYLYTKFGRTFFNVANRIDENALSECFSRIILSSMQSIHSCFTQIIAVRFHNFRHAIGSGRVIEI
jgi:hypothetical protein